MTRACAICEEEIEPGNETQIESSDDPSGSFDDDALAHQECLRRHRAAIKQTKRMFRDKPKGPSNPETVDIDEDALDDEIEEIEAHFDELLDETRDDESRDYDALTDIEDPKTDFDEEEIDAKLDELLAEIRDEDE